MLGATLKFACEAATFGALSGEKGFQIGALRVLRRVSVSLFAILADFHQLFNHRNSVALIHNPTSIVSDATYATGLDGYLRNTFKVAIQVMSLKRIRRVDWNGSPYFRAGTCLEAAYPIAKRFRL
jgi:hypothetical protein